MSEVSREELLQQNEELKQRVNNLEANVAELKEAIELTNLKSSNVIERLGKVLGEEMEFVKDLMGESIDQAKVYADTLKENFLELSFKVGKTSRNMFTQVQNFFEDNVPLPFKKVSDFIGKQFDLENDAHFLDFDNKMLVAKEKAVLEIAKLKGKIDDVKEYLSDEKASWVSAFRHEGWKLAEKLGLHEEKNLELIKKLEDSTKIFGQSIVALNSVVKEVSKEKAQVCNEWIKKNLLDTVDKTRESVEKALNSTKSVARSLYTLSPKEFFKSALEGVEKAVALKDGYKIDGRGELYVPKLSELAKDKYKEALSPIADKFKRITEKASVLIKKEGAYDQLGVETKAVSSRSHIMAIEDVPNDISFRDISKGEMEVLTAKTDSLYIELDKAVKNVSFGGHNDKEVLETISKDMKDVTETFDKTVGQDYLQRMNSIVIENEIIFSVENDLGLKPTLIENSDYVEEQMLDLVDKTQITDSLKDAKVEFSYFYSSKLDTTVMKEDIIARTGTTVSYLYDMKEVENNDIKSPLRINFQKEMDGEVKTFFDKATDYYNVSLGNNNKIVQDTLYVTAGTRLIYRELAKSEEGRENTTEKEVDEALKDFIDKE